MWIVIQLIVTLAEIFDGKFRWLELFIQLLFDDWSNIQLDKSNRNQLFIV